MSIGIPFDFPPIVKIQLRYFTARTGQQFLESAPQQLSKTLLLINEASVDDKEIHSILRHADICTTQAYPAQSRTNRSCDEEARQDSAQKVRYKSIGVRSSTVRASGS